MLLYASHRHGCGDGGTQLDHARALRIPKVVATVLYAILRIEDQISRGVSFPFGNVTLIAAIKEMP
ncbi:hypothetical protein [Luteimonas saliphila]|uniref:hypothetical protein n=1 Tax=Luteimonas saliphila TaxID=2804919 RepID=UPI00192D683D|nr:hypothetical protein [Luteimonas saliphila]